MWPLWGATTRTTLLDGARGGRAICEGMRPQAGVVLSLLRELREGGWHTGAGPERVRQDLARARLAAIIDRIPGYRPDLWELRILVGELELRLHELADHKPAGETWPRNSRPIYEEALGYLEEAGRQLSRASGELDHLLVQLEALERPGRASATAWLSTLPAALIAPQRAAQGVVDALGATHHALLELSNTLLRVRVDGDDE